MEIVPANEEQIGRFKQAAAQRYKELGVNPQLAEILFDRQLSKTAEELGIELDPKAAKCPAHGGGTSNPKGKKGKKGKKYSKKAEALAQAIRQVLGR